MVARSPTYVCPVEYICDTRCLGIYDPLGVEAADRLLMTGPGVVDAAMVSGLLAQMASEEPGRYDTLAKAGFPVFDSCSPQAVLMSNLLERAGGHYIDIGGKKLLAEGKVIVKGGVEPIALTATGLLFSDGTGIDVDAIVWCTGFNDKNAQSTVAEILGSSNEMAEDGSMDKKHLLGPQDIAVRLDHT